MHTRILLAALLAASLLTACEQKTDPKSAPTPAMQQKARAERAPAPRAPRAPGGLSGEVLETMDASAYTYARLKTDKGEVWVAAPKTVLKVGEQVTVRDPMEMQGFESETLGRRFDRILFVGAYEKGAPAGAKPAPPHAGPMGGKPNPHAGMMGGPMGGQMKGAMGGDGGAKKHMASAQVKITAVAKAEGEHGRTVGDVHAQAGALTGKPVHVRGVVAKFTPGILGRNWIHIQDTTGDPAARTHDLTVTSLDVAEKGDTVLIKGTLATDKDFGAGYKYAVIVEEATVTVEPK